MMTTIDRILHEITYKDFYDKYLIGNRPCIFSSSFTEKWACRKNWVQDNQPNLSYLKEKYGHLSAPVVDCSKKYFSAHEKTDMTIKEYCSYWRNRNDNVLYLKDWHLQRLSLDTDNFYEVPVYFSSDWLNEFWDFMKKDDYRFVYIGVKGSWTPFHADVFRSYSWSANVCGLKKWLLYPPGKEENLKDKFGKLPFDIESSCDTELYPNQLNAELPIEVLQEEGEIIFVPSNWHHQVYNLEDTISINHNWINAANIHKMFSFIRLELDDVKKEISDCIGMDGFHEQCQLILRASAGVDFFQFFQMLKYLGTTRLAVINEMMNNGGTENMSISKLFISDKPMKRDEKHKKYIVDKAACVKFDLLKIKDVLMELICCEEFKKIANEELSLDGEKLCLEIETVLASAKI